MLATIRRIFSFARRVPGGLRRRAARVRTRLWLGSGARQLPAPGGGLTLFFAPDAGLEPHFAGVCVLARVLAERGHRVVILRCFESLPRCPVKEMHRLPVDATDAVERRICLDCATASRRYTSVFGLDSIDLRSLGVAEVSRRARAIVAGAPDDLRELVVEGLPFGRLCMADLSLTWKVSEYDAVDPAKRLMWARYVESALISYFLVERAIERLGAERLVHFNDYPIMLAARSAAAKRGVPAFSLTFASHLNIDRRRYMIGAEPWYTGLGRVEATWPEWRDLALPPAVVDEIADDLLDRFEARGSHQFSPTRVGQDVRAALGLPANRKLLVAYTSSLDERVATSSVRAFLGTQDNVGPSPFTDQIAWLGALIDIVSKSNDLAVVVRVHPREGATKGNPTRSEFLDRLRAFSGTSDPNIRFVWPEERVSSYDLAEAADLALTSWSTIGLELARVGVPVLAAWRITPFPIADGFVEWASSRAEWQEKLRALIGRAAELPRLVSAFRWYQRYVLAPSLDLGDLVAAKDHEGLPRWSPPAAAPALEDVIFGRRSVVAVNHERLSRAQHPGAVADEHRALKRALRRICHVVFLGRPPAEDFQLTVRGGAERPLAPREHRVELSGSRVTWTTAEGAVDRVSPLVARLAPLAAQIPSCP